MQIDGLAQLGLRMLHYGHQLATKRYYPMEKQSPVTFAGLFTTFLVLIIGLIRGDFTLADVFILATN